MEVLFFFLNWTASFSHVDEETGSKMDAHNLATVITPNILYIKENGQGAAHAAQQAADSGDSYFLSIESVNILIEEQAQFSEVPADVLTVLQYTNLGKATTEVSTKEIISRYEQFMKDDGAQTAIAAAQQQQTQRKNEQQQQQERQKDQQQQQQLPQEDQYPQNNEHDGQATNPPTTTRAASQAHSATARTSIMPEVDTMSNSETRPAPIRVDTEFAQRVARDHEMYTSIKRVHDSPGGGSPNSASPKGQNSTAIM